MILSTEIKTEKDDYTLKVDPLRRLFMEEQFVQVQFDDGTSVNLNEEELKNAAALAEKGCLSD